MGKERTVYRALVGKSGGTKPLGRLRCRKGDNTKMELIGIGWGGMYWIHQSQNRDHWRLVLNTVIKLGVQ
jgi:hypothetical protein